MPAIAHETISKNIQGGLYNLIYKYWIIIVDSHKQTNQPEKLKNKKKLLVYINHC